MSREEPEERASGRAGGDAATRDRIVRGAAEVVFRLGVAGMSIERARAASGASRSQVYRCFPANEALIDVVVDFQIAAVLARQRSLLASLGSLGDLKVWPDDVVELNREQKSARGCPLGSLVSQLAEQSGAMRAKLEHAFQTWQSYLAAGLHRMQDRGELNAEADVAELATGVVAVLQWRTDPGSGRSERETAAGSPRSRSRQGRARCPAADMTRPADSESGRA